MVGTQIEFRLELVSDLKIEHFHARTEAVVIAVNFYRADKPKPGPCHRSIG